MEESCIVVTIVYRMTRHLKRAHTCEEKVAAALTEKTGARIIAFSKLHLK